MKPEKTFTHAGVTCQIIQDENAESPDSWGNEDLFLVGYHRQFWVAEPGAKDRAEPDCQELVDRWQGSHWLFPLEAYIHSGVRLSLSNEGNFPDRQWDVSQLGFVFVSRKDWPDAAKAREAALSLVETWNKYLSGDIYGFVVGEDTEHEESCWGFYGMEAAEDEAKSMAEHVAKAIAKDAEAARQLVLETQLAEVWP